MKKLLLSSVTLILFSVSIMIFQVSCQKEAFAQNSQLPPATRNSIGGIIVGAGLDVSPSGVVSLANTDTTISEASQNKLLIRRSSAGDPSLAKYALLNYDGTGKTDINITLPSGHVDNNSTYLSPDSKILFLEAYNPSTQTIVFYSYVIATNTLTSIYVDPSGAADLLGVY